MTAEVSGLSGQQRSEEWVIIADGIDNIAVDRGRGDNPALALGFEQKYGSRDVGWRVVEQPLEHNLVGGFAKAFGMFPVRVEVTVAALEQEQQRLRVEQKIWGMVSRNDFERGLEKMIAL